MPCHSYHEIITFFTKHSYNRIMMFINYRIIFESVRFVGDSTRLNLFRLT